MQRLLVTALVAGLFAPACRKPETVVVNNITVYRAHWEKAMRDVGTRAEFDLQCPFRQLSFTLFRKRRRTPSEVGVIGCGKQAIYVWLTVPQVWVMNVDEPPAYDPDGPPPPVPPAQPAPVPPDAPPDAPVPLDPPAPPDAPPSDP